MNPFHKDYYYQVSHMRLILSEIRIQIYIPGVSDTASEQVTVCFNNVLPQRSRHNHKSAIKIPAAIRTRFGTYNHLFVPIAAPVLQNIIISPNIRHHCPG